MSRSVTSSLRRAFEGVIFDGERLSDALGKPRAQHLGQRC